MLARLAPFEAAFCDGEGCTRVDPLLAALARGERPPEADALARSLVLDPATDDRPFFKLRVRFSALSPRNLAAILRVGVDGRRAIEDQPVAEAALVMLTLLAVLVAALTLLVPLRRLRVRSRAPVSPAVVAYFAALGLAFALVEVSTTQRYTLYLGEPAYTLAVTLATLLIASGCGSAFAASHAAAPRRGIAIALALVAAALAFQGLLLPAALDRALSLPFAVRIGLVVVTLLPLGFGLGMPMPLGLRLCRARGEVTLAYGLGVNGFCSVLGACAAMYTAMTGGFRFTLALAALLYASALATSRRL
jgi:hypothetical protein